MSEIRVRRRGKYWGVQERKRWIGLAGDRSSRWPDSSGALWFANLCERVDARRAATMGGSDD